MSSTSEIATPHTPPYEFDQLKGYHRVGNENTIAGQHTLGDNSNSAAEDEQDYESDDDLDLFGDDLAASNPNDYTKSYNRQRNLHNSKDAESQYAKIKPQKPKANLDATIDDQISSLSRHAGKIKLDDHAAGLKVGSSNIGSEKSDRATNEQVLDPRTRMILLQLINRGIVSEVHGCISTGKEANVYYAFLQSADTDGKVKHLAIKIYKTAILHFKDRSKYVSGEFRFQKGFAKRSNRGMVRLWAEKEFRNLKRMHGVGLPVPEAIYLKSHVLVMDFVGSLTRGGQPVPAPLLREIALEDEDDDRQAAQWRQLYTQVACNMRVMYQACRLVHADLSEYNMLCTQESTKVTIIDVSQSVEHDHPRSLDFLRSDIKNITNFFTRKGVNTLKEPSMYYFIVQDKDSKSREEMQNKIDHLVENPIKLDVDEDVFRQQHIPQGLSELHDFDQKHEASVTEHEMYRDLLAKQTVSSPHVQDSESLSVASGPNGDAGINDPQPMSGSDSEDNAKEPKKNDQPRGKRFQDKAERKEHKATVKEEKREKRKTKMPKHIKKKLVTNTSRSHKR